MPTAVEAIYEGGVLRPIEPIPLPEGTHVEVIVMLRERPARSASPADVLATIAAMPMEAGGHQFNGRDHDRVLYSEPGSQ
jgi:predicted DNA-binding antitoxin AbrB/MazE fold protein